MLISKPNVDSNSAKFDTSTATRLLANSLQEHLETFQALIETTLTDIERSGQLLCQALGNGRKVLICGNGGSAADAQHIAAELVGRYEKNRRSFPAIALTTDTSALTAVSNDYGFDQVFARQVAGLAQSGDVLVAISTSGKSQNVLNAVQKARELGCVTIALTGAGSEPLASACDLSVIVPSQRTSRIQEAHITIGHLWCEMVDELLSDML
ncbi:MAG TPA: D-sedoheptulose 7-phosphate isomerase [Pyrinomonadaceae bacterium]|jgi:D-sedoheptulose 7-phosphate isomerase|nr:D-sedoheptulose 7-phosphate isomerase [Pyrinomonadaceae bacterium]